MSVIVYHILIHFGVWKRAKHIVYHLSFVKDWTVCCIQLFFHSIAVLLIFNLDLLSLMFYIKLTVRVWYWYFKLLTLPYFNYAYIIKLCKRMLPNNNLSTKHRSIWRQIAKWQSMLLCFCFPYTYQYRLFSFLLGSFPLYQIHQ